MLVNIKVLTGNFTKNDSFCAVELKLKIQMKKQRWYIKRLHLLRLHLNVFCLYIL